MTPKNPDNRICIVEWETIAVTALPPGWHNVYRLDDKTVQVSPCPAILLQEARAETMAWDEYKDGRPERCTRTEPAEPPFETRAVFADCDGADLCPASEARNYERTLGPGEPIPQEAAW